MILKNNMQTHLNPVVALFGYCAYFPEEQGKYTCQIHVDKGSVEFCHGAYNVETGCWDDAPDGKDASKIVLHEGDTKELQFTCGNHYGQTDNIWIANGSYVKPASFTCNYSKQ